VTRCPDYFHVGIRQQLPERVLLHVRPASASLAEVLQQDGRQRGEELEGMLSVPAGERGVGKTGEVTNGRNHRRPDLARLPKPVIGGISTEDEQQPQRPSYLC